MPDADFCRKCGSKVTRDAVQDNKGYVEPSKSDSNQFDIKSMSSPEEVERRLRGDEPATSRSHKSETSMNVPAEPTAADRWNARETCETVERAGDERRTRWRLRTPPETTSK